MDGHQRAEISQSNEPSTSHQRAINDNVLMKEGENGTNPLRPLTGTSLGKGRTPYSLAGDSGIAEHLLPGTLKHLVRPDLETIKKLKSRLSALFSREAKTAWGEKELTVLHRISRRPGVLDEMTLLEKAHASGWTWHRQDIPTTLNNWTGELDRARQILNHPNKANIDTKTCVQPNVNNTAVYWDRNLTRHTSLGRKTEDFQICGFKTQTALLDRMAERLDLIWKQAVGDVMWNSKASERPERMEFYRVQADQFLGFINTVKEYRGDFRSNMHENPFTVLDKLAPFLLDKWGDAKWDVRPYRTVRCYSDKWWAEFVTYLEDTWRINFTTGQRKDQ